MTKAQVGVIMITEIKRTEATKMYSKELYGGKIKRTCEVIQLHPDMDKYAIETNTGINGKTEINNNMPFFKTESEAECWLLKNGFKKTN